MKLKRIIVLCHNFYWQKFIWFAFAFIFSICAVPKELEARYAAIIVDGNTGDVIFSRNANAPRYPASLTKMMTLYLAFDALDNGKLKLKQKLPVSRRAAGQAPSKLGLRAGQTISVENAMLAMISKSANDAATVIAESLSKSEILFAKKMTKKARSLGMKRTTFKNATGLPNRRQKSTANDMIILARALLENHKKHYHYFSTKKFNYNGKVFTNHNRLLSNYEGTDGIKTGYIRASGFNIAASVERDGKRLVGIVFGGRSAKSRDKHIHKLFDRAFAVTNNNKLPKPNIKPKKFLLSKKLLASKKEKNIKKYIHIKKKIANDKLSKKNKTNEFKNKKWAIQVGAFRKKSDAYAQVVKASRLFPAGLGETTISITSVLTKGHELFRARMIKMSRNDAKSACNILSTHGIPCNPISINDG